MKKKMNQKKKNKFYLKKKGIQKNLKENFFK